jgi:hypothetical protein
MPFGWFGRTEIPDTSPGVLLNMRIQKLTTTIQTINNNIKTVKFKVTKDNLNDYQTRLDQKLDMSDYDWFLINFNAIEIEFNADQDYETLICMFDVRKEIDLSPGSTLYEALKRLVGNVSGGAKSVFVKTGAQVTFVKDKKKYTRNIMVKKNDKRQTKYVKLNGEMVLVSKLKKA